jgi:hypothetical protein
VLNLNDPCLLIEALPNLEPVAKAALRCSRALLLSPLPPTTKLVKVDPIVPGDPVAQEFAHFNVSQEALYRRQRRGRVAGMSSGGSTLHCPIATNLSQLPLPCSLTREILLQPHHPLGIFVPFDAPCVTALLIPLFALCFPLTAHTTEVKAEHDYSTELPGISSLWAAICWSKFDHFAHASAFPLTAQVKELCSGDRLEHFTSPSTCHSSCTRQNSECACQRQINLITSIVW